MDNIRVATVPGSKSITNRALLLAALSNREYLLKGAQFSDDSRFFLGALKDLGFSVQEDEAAKTVLIKGAGGRIPKKNADIYVGSAGTAARFLTAMLACSDGNYTIRASRQMAGRPMKPLFDALTSLGAVFTWLGEPGHLPVTVRGIFAENTQRNGASTDSGVDAQRDEPVPAGSGDVRRNEVSLDISESTQYLSALLMTASMLPEGLVIHITGEKKRGSYIEITRRMMEEFGIPSEFDGESYVVKGKPLKADPASATGRTSNTDRDPGTDGAGSACQASQSDFTGQKKDDLPTDARYTDYQIEPDVSAACYFYAAAMLTGGSVQVRHIHSDSMQGDMKFLRLLEQMGAVVEDLPDGTCVTALTGQSPSDDNYMTALTGQSLFGDICVTASTGQGVEHFATVPGHPDPGDDTDGTNMAEVATASFPGVEVNMNDFSDQAITLAALAPFASSPTVISGIAHIRRQESDRLGGIVENLRRMGIRAEESEDSVKIWPGDPKPCEIETFDDHRMAMGFALTGLRVPGMRIRHPECCRKTFKEYFEEMDRVFGLKISG